jgi:hypothetical protein
MRWDRNVTVENGGAPTADPIAAPATVPPAYCFRLPKKNPESAQLNNCLFFGLNAPNAETVDVELYALDDDQYDPETWVPAVTDRWMRVCRIEALEGGVAKYFEPFFGGGMQGKGGFFYLRVLNETVTADRVLNILATPGSTNGLSSSGVIGGDIDLDEQLWPSLAGAAADPTAAYVVSTSTFRVGEKSFLLGQATVTVLDCDAIQIRADRSVDDGATWREVDVVTIPAAAVGVHQFVMDLPESGLYRIAARRYGGGGTSRMVIEAEAVERPVEIGRDGNPMELLNVKEVGILSWHNAGVAQTLTLNFATSTSGGWIPVGRANMGKLVVTLTGGVGATVEAQIHESPDDTPTDLIPELTNWIAGNIRNVGPAEHQILGANGTYVIRFPVEPGSQIRSYLKYTGGAAPDALGRLYLWKE